MHPGKILDELLQPGAELWEKQKTTQNSLLISQLQDFNSICKDYYQSLNNLPEDTSIAEIWKNLGNYCQNILNWVTGITALSDQSVVTDLWTEWQTHLIKILRDVPESLEILLQDLTLKNPDDKNIGLKLWKAVHRARIRLANLLNRTGNYIRTFLKRPPRKSKAFTRDFPFHSFITYYPGLNFAQELFMEWLTFLRVAAKLLAEFHRITEALKDELLQPDEFLSGCDMVNPAQVRKHMESVKDLIKNVENQISELRGNSVDSSRRLEETWQNITDTVLKKWEYKGTPLVPSKQMKSAEIENKRNNLEKNLAEAQEAWKDHLVSEMEDWRKDLELSLLQAETALICKNRESLISEKINSNFIPHFRETIKIIDQSQEKFSRLNSGQMSKFGQQIISENQHLLGILRKEQLPHIVDEIRVANIEEEFGLYLSEVRQSVEKLSDQHLIFTHQDTEHLIPRSRNNHIALKNLVFEEFFSGIKARHEKSMSEIHERVESIVRQVAETDQIVEFNLDAAFNLLQAEQDNTRAQASQLVSEGLERTRKHVEELTTQSKAISEFIQHELQDITREFENNIQNLGDNQKILELKVRIAKVKTQEEIRDKTKKVIRTARHIIPVIFNYVKTVLESARENYFQFRKLTGLSSRIGTMEEELSQFLTETNKRIQALPYVYQRLFRPEPLEDERFFSGRSAEMEQLKEQFDSWDKGNYAVTAIVGERGSGKTTLLNFAQNEYCAGRVLHKFDFSRRITGSVEWLNELKNVLNLPHIESFDELERHIASEEIKQIFIVENLQYLFIRSVHGFKTLERFLLFISRTNEHIYWLITCTIYSWTYLDKVINLSKYFRRVVLLENLPLEEMESIVLKRHRVSGYRLTFSVPEEISGSRKYRKLSLEEERQGYLQKNFFRDLNDFSSGNVTITLLFWLRAIQEVTKEQITVHPIINFDFSFLHQLPSDELFAMAAFMQHENLDSEHFSLIFRQNPEKSSLLLSRLYNSGILLKNSRGFYIHPFLYRAVVRTLKLKNILH